MREMHFRGKRHYDGQWVEGGIIPLDTDSGYVFIAEPFLSASTLPVHEIIKHHTHLVIPATVGQYTGMTDKHGKKIFEGDIVRVECRGIVKATNGCVYFKDGIYMISYISSALSLYAYRPFCEVVGNIHDNPELLKGGD